MTIDTSTVGAGLATANSRAQTAMTKLGDDYDSFLTLLTAQIQNQDPLQPVDSTTFVSQLAQLTQVEQSIVANGSLEAIEDRLASAGALAEVGLIGRSVQVPTDRVELSGGSASYSYTLPEDAAEVTAIITAADGTEVRALKGLPAGAGQAHALTWDGLDSAGLPVPDGTFTVAVTAKDAEGETLAVTGTAVTTVEELAFDETGARLRLANGDTVASTAVQAVY